jgi:hypothetical protein
MRQLEQGSDLASGEIGYGTQIIAGQRLCGQGKRARRGGAAGCYSVLQ